MRRLAFLLMALGLCLVLLALQYFFSVLSIGGSIAGGLAILSLSVAYAKPSWRLGFFFLYLLGLGCGSLGLIELLSARAAVLTALSFAIALLLLFHLAFALEAQSLPRLDVQAQSSAAQRGLGVCAEKVWLAEPERALAQEEAYGLVGIERLNHKAFWAQCLRQPKAYCILWTACYQLSWFAILLGIWQYYEQPSAVIVAFFWTLVAFIVADLFFWPSLLHPEWLSYWLRKTVLRALKL